jgi:hypothetical protein
MKATIFLFGISAILVACTQANERSSGAATTSQSEIPIAVYERCLAPTEHTLVEDLKYPAYAELVSKNNRTGPARDYVSGPYSRALTSEPFPIRIALRRAADTSSREFSRDELTQILDACATDPMKLRTLNTPLRQRFTKIVGAELMRQVPEVMRSTREELNKRGLKPPFE